jgi:hypothetical protein
VSRAAAPGRRPSRARFYTIESCRMGVITRAGEELLLAAAEWRAFGCLAGPASRVPSARRSLSFKAPHNAGSSAVSRATASDAAFPSRARLSYRRIAASARCGPASFRFFGRNVLLAPSGRSRRSYSVRRKAMSAALSSGFSESPYGWPGTDRYETPWALYPVGT